MGDPEIVVAVIDTGVDINHPDIADNIWTNPGEIPGDGIDNDSNGYVDDINGWDFYNDDNTVFDPADEDYHGTHVAGTMAAVANNSTGVAGVAPNVKIMPLKFIGLDGGTTSDAIEAIEYATAMGVRVSNNSWGRGTSLPASGIDLELQNAINSSGQVFVAAAGNGDENNIGINNDIAPDSPSGLNSTNIIAVAAINNGGGLASFSNYGVTSVDIGAPGVDILSLQPVYSSPDPENAYQYLSGTSMATPHVAGAAALVLSVNPDLTPDEVNQILMDTGVPLPSLTGKTVSGKLVNAYNAVFAADTIAPEAPSVNPVDDNDTVVTGTAEPNNTVTVYDNVYSTVINSAAAAGDGAFTVSVDTQPSGKVLKITAKDNRGNESAGTLVTVTDGTSPPAPDIVTLTNDSYVNITNVNSFTFSGTEDEAGADVKLYCNGSQLLGSTAAAGGAWTMIVDLSGLTDGPLSITATASDAAGNVSSPSSAKTLIKDTVNPTFTVTTAPNPAPSGDVTVTVAANETLQEAPVVVVGGNTVTMAPTSTVNVWEVSYPISTENGIINITVAGTDAAGNSGSAGVSFTADTIAPDKPYITAPTAGEFGYNSSITVSGYAYEPGIGINIYKDNEVLVGTGTVESSVTGSVYHFSVTANLGSTGTFLIVAKAIDGAGNVSSGSNTVSYTVNESTDGGGGGGGGGGAVPAVDEDSVTVQIDPDEQTSVELGDDVTVEIPSGAFAGKVTLVLAKIRGLDKDYDKLIPDEDENLVIGSVIIDISAKDGEQPSKGITVTLKFDTGKVTDVNKLGVYYYNEAKGKWEFIGGRVNAAEGTISVVLKHFSKYAVMEYSRTFADITGHWAKADIELMAARHIADGVDETRFAPEAEITRAEFAALLVRSLGLEQLESSGRFQDIAFGEWHAGYVEAAYSAGIVAGLSDSSFAPDANITREQMAVMMARAYRYSAGRELAVENPVSFADAAAISAWAVQGVDQTGSAGIINGMTEDTFAPGEEATRAQGIVMLKRLLEKLEVILIS
nr:S8 family serine peptidase [Phosphitispora fastidiosa]